MLPDFLKKLFIPKTQKKEVTLPDNLFVQCPSCKSTLYHRYLERNSGVCTSCGHHFSLSVAQWIELLADRKTFHALWQGLRPLDRLAFPGYAQRTKTLDKAEPEEALAAGELSVDGHPILIGVMNPQYLMASLGAVAGEKITRLFEHGRETGKPVVLIIRSGGARMQEGVQSLMQMAKTAAALRAFSDAGGLYIALLTQPTTGGVSASYAMLGDIIWGEPGALIGFAGPRVIEQTIRQKLPEGFQRAEFLLEKGFLDGVVPRTELRQTLANVLSLHAPAPRKEGFPWPKLKS